MLKSCESCAWRGIPTQRACLHQPDLGGGWLRRQAGAASRALLTRALTGSSILLLAACSTTSLPPWSPSGSDRTQPDAGRNGPVAVAPIESATSLPPTTERSGAVSTPVWPQAIDELIGSVDRAQQAMDSSNPVVAAQTDPDPDLVAGETGNLWDRIREGFALPDLDSELVARHQRFYLSQPDYLNRMMTRAGRYLYHIVEEIERRDMPLEIALLPFVESAMNPVALSSAQAAGLWQFIPSTGRQYDLKQNWWVDNRRDVVQSTRAALDYLQMLHDMHDGDWFLALASYNWGEGAVSRAVKRNRLAGKPTDYLSLNMPGETRNYVPKLMALKNIVQNAQVLGVNLPEVADKPYFVVIEKTRPIDLDLAAQFAGLTTTEFVALNPAHNRPVISASRNNQIKIPADNLDRFLAAIDTHEAAGKAFVTWRPYTLTKSDTLASVAKRAGVSEQRLLQANSLSSKRQIIAGTQILVPGAKGADARHIEAFHAPTIVEIVNRPARYHRVAQRETLATISKRWGVAPAILRQWNGLASDQVRKGQRLIVRQASRQTVQTSAQGATRILSATAAHTPVVEPASQHTVQRGENLGSIASRHGVSIDQLREWNHLNGNSIRIGQRLTISDSAVTRLAANPSGGAAEAKNAAKGEYRVRQGDTLGAIASRHGVPIDDVRRWNGIKGNIVRIGQTLRLSPQESAPVAMAERLIRHRVQRGDTLIGIANRYDVSVEQLRTWNRLRDDNIRLGEQIQIRQPAGKLSGKLT